VSRKSFLSPMAMVQALWIMNIAPSEMSTSSHAHCDARGGAGREAIDVRDDLRLVALEGGCDRLRGEHVAAWRVDAHVDGVDVEPVDLRDELCAVTPPQYSASHSDDTIVSYRYSVAFATGRRAQRAARPLTCRLSLSSWISWFFRIRVSS
jgi:hypothetical protein